MQILKTTVCTTVESLTTALRPSRSAGKKIGFVPTMGALHDGHSSLIKRSHSENDITVCSIFVNPTQFNNPNDLANYPRMEEQDLSLLEMAGCDIAFIPSVKEVYPFGDQLMDIHFGALEETMEGAFRPGHFRGVATVVNRLFEIVNPTVARSLVVAIEFAKAVDQAIMFFGTIRSTLQFLSPHCAAGSHACERHHPFVQLCQENYRGTPAWPQPKLRHPLRPPASHVRLGGPIQEFQPHTC